MSGLACTGDLGFCRCVQATVDSWDVAKSSALRSLSVVLVCGDGGGWRLVKSPVVERGVLTAPATTWDAAVRRPEVIGQLAARRTSSTSRAQE